MKAQRVHQQLAWRLLQVYDYVNTARRGCFLCGQAKHCCAAGLAAQAAEGPVHARLQLADAS